MNTVKIADFEVLEKHLFFFSQIFKQSFYDLFLPDPFFEHKKRYKLIKGYEVNSQRFYIKEYFDHFEEAESEWENLFKLQSLEFSVPDPFFKRKSLDKVEIATFELKGKPLSELLKDQREQDILFYKLAELLSSLHLKNLYHQDCYLNHFFWDEKTKTLGFLDVSRILINPRFPLKYRIKDLAQLGYSFEEYLGKNAPPLFQKFLSYYLDLSGIKLKCLVKSLVKFKVWLIRWRTKRAKKRGKRL